MSTPERVNGRTLTMQELTKIIGCKSVAEELRDVKVNRVLTQSVYAEPGDAVIAVRWYDVKRTVSEALQHGVAVVFCERKYAQAYSDPRVTAVDDPLECVVKFESFCEQGCTAKRIAITGSVGKTTTTGLINSVIANTYKTLTHHPMSNSHGAILRNFQLLDPEHEFWVQEVGGVQPGYIEASARMLRPDALVLTNIGTSHLDKYGTREAIFRDKSSLERCEKSDGVVIVNYDDEMLKNADYNHKVISFAVNDKNADYYAENIIMDEQGTAFDLVCAEGRYAARLNLFGTFNVYNALAAIAVGRWAGVPIDKIIDLLKQYMPSGMRQNMMNIGGYKLLLDSFNAEPKTVLGSADTLAQIKMSGNGRKIFITGHIDKLGEDSVKMHTDLGYELAKLDIDEMVFYAGDSKYTYDAVVKSGYKNAHFMDSRKELDDWIRNNITRDDVTFYKSGQFKAALAKSVDHVYGTRFQNEQQFNEGNLETSGDFEFRLRQDDIIEINKYNGADKCVTIPDAYNGVPVLRIGTGAFRRNADAESVAFPNTVDNIGQEAFYDCANLSKVSLPEGLKYIHRSAFNHCKKLKKVTLPKGLIHIEMRAFGDCSALKRIYIPETVGFIGEEAFARCRKLVIECEKGSYAETYAIKNNIPYKTARSIFGFAI